MIEDGQTQSAFCSFCKNDNTKAGSQFWNYNHLGEKLELGGNAYSERVISGAAKRKFRFPARAASTAIR
jgi:hypothetical protein